MWNELYVMKKKKSLSKLLRQLFKSSYMHISHKRRTNCINKITSQMAKKWMRLKMFQLTHTHILKLTSCWSVFYNWSYVDSLGLNACKWVALRTGMYLFLWYGLVLFRLDETTKYMWIFIHIYIYLLTLVIMKWFHLTCCEKK